MTNALKRVAPNDLYLSIWAELRRLVIEDGFTNIKLLDQWEADGTARTVGKKAIFMGGQYGAGRGQMIRDFWAVLKPLPEDKRPTYEECKIFYGKKDLNGLETSNFELAIDKVCSISGMVKWCQELARQTHAAGKKTLIIPTVTGSKVLMRYSETERVTFDTFHCGSIGVGSKVNHNQKSHIPCLEDWMKAITANLVHTADAALLGVALADWEWNLTTVHDCVQTAPGAGMDILVRRMRAGYHQVVSWDIWNEVAAANGIDISTDPALSPPVIGDLNLEDTQAANYMFC